MRILIAEDDATSRLLLKRVLTGWGYAVTVTADGDEALRELLAVDAPRLAILDWMMPGMDGVDVCRRLRALETRQPPYLILLTALDKKGDVVTGLEAGADDYVGKPYDPDELRARVAVGRRLVELNERLIEAQEALQVLARTDGLTGVLNRVAILTELEMEISRERREGGRLSVGMLDIDFFKKVNDTYGHAAGDAVLREVVARAASGLRPYDRLGRFGGEEFLVILPGSGEAELGVVLERMRASVAAGPVTIGASGVSVTVSLGGAVHEDETTDGLIARADAALYVAKGRGRDCVALAGPAAVGDA